MRKIAVYGIEDQFIDLSAFSGPQLPDWISRETIYEVYVRAFSKEGTFCAVTEQISALKQRGFNVLWFMPIYPIGKENRKGNLGSPYSIRDYFNVNPEYGTNADFKALIEQAHGLEMRVLIDIVPNHVAFDYNKLTESPELIKRDSNGQPFRRVADWTDIAELDYSQQATRQHVLQIMKHWITEFAVDGFRVDVAGMVPRDFWEWAIPQLRNLKPDFYLLAEWEDPRLHLAGFNSGYDWTLYALLKKVIAGREPAQILADWLQLQKLVYPRHAAPLRFLENHDKKRAVSVFQGEAIFPAMVFLFSVDGIPLIYNGQEIGAGHEPSLFEQEAIDWSNVNQSLRDAYSKLIRLRRQMDALASSVYVFHIAEKSEDVLIYEKHGSERLLAIINFKNRVRSIKLKNELSEALKKHEVVFNSHDSLNLEDDTSQLLPFQAILLKI